MAARQLGHVASPARASTSRPSEPFPHRVPPSGSGAWVHGPAVAGDRAAQAGQTLEPGAPSKTAPQPARWQPQTTNPGVPVPLGASSSSILGDPAASVSELGAGSGGFEGLPSVKGVSCPSNSFGLSGGAAIGPVVGASSLPPGKAPAGGGFPDRGESFTGPPATCSAAPPRETVRPPPRWSGGCSRRPPSRGRCWAGWGRLGRDGFCQPMHRRSVDMRVGLRHCRRWPRPDRIRCTISGFIRSQRARVGNVQRGAAVKVGFPIKPPDYIRGETAARGAVATLRPEDRWA